ncbi:glycosyltransferase family 9 protein [Lichenicoccus sp.]|uniref:glycosyltransferase family 9 protein n=1 Tax=Lichenicoccus sp. TaxID=2781899 RepID=UPI003D09C5F4
MRKGLGPKGLAQEQWFSAMRRGDHVAAWAISDDILAGRDPALRDDPTQPYHCRWVWDGRCVADRQVLVRCYHGLGDTLQFARYLPALRARCTALTLEVQSELLGLDFAGPDRIVAFVAEAPLAASECDIEIMELAHALRLRPQDVGPASISIRGRGGGIGLCAQAGGWDPARSLPDGVLAPLLAGPTVTLLHPGTPGCPARIEDTAALIAGLDLVITVDTMVAHLAGTLGRPTWLLLKHAADWRWMEGRTDCPWYPSMRLFRQPAPGDWRAVVEAVLEALRHAH